MNLADLWSIITEVASVVTIVGGAALGMVVWSAKKTFVSNESFAALEKRADVLEQRVITLDTRVDNIPTPVDIHPLEIALANLRGEIKALSVDLQGQSQLMIRLEKSVFLLTTHHMGEKP